MSGLEWMVRLDGAGYQLMKFFLSILWQSTIVLLSAGALSWLLRWRSAAVRHAVWAGALLTIPLIPFLGWLASTLGTPPAPIPVIPAYELRQQLPVNPDADRPSLLVYPSKVNRLSDQAPVASVAETLPPPAVSREISLFERIAAFFSLPWVLLLAGYFSGALLLLGRLLRVRLQIRTWVSRSTAVRNPELVRVFEAVGAELGIRRPVRIAESGSIAGPLTVNFVRPVVLLPYGFSGMLTEGELRALALHELTHIQRNDIFILTTIALLRALLFFHPLIWIASRQVEQYAELACDDAVVAASGEPLGYAKMLARVAEYLSGYGLHTDLTAGMLVSRSAFFLRVEALLSSRRDRIRKLSRIALAGTMAASGLAIALALALPIGERGERVTVSGVVSFGTRPVGNAELYLVVADRSGRALSPVNRKVTRSDADGRFRFKRSHLRSELARGGVFLVALHSGYALGWEELAEGVDLERLAISLNRPLTITGLAVDGNGKPLPGVGIRVREIVARNNLIAERSRMLFLDARIPHIAAKTDARGRFVLRGVPENCSLGIIAGKNGYGYVRIQAIPAGSEGVNLTLRPGAVIKGRVLSHPEGKPAGGVRVVAVNTAWTEFNPALVTGQTDRHGQYSLENLSSGVYTVYTLIPGERPDRVSVPREKVTVGEGKTAVADLALVRGGLVSGKISDAETGAPLANRKVSAGLGRMTVTDSRGRYSLRLAPGESVLEVRSPEGYIRETAQKTVNVTERGAVGSIDFSFARGIALTGALHTTDGKPVAGAQVFTSFPGYEYALSGPAGEFVLRGLKPGERLKVKALHAGRYLRSRVDVEVFPGIRLDLVMDPYETSAISGRVVGPDGKPAPRVEIQLIRLEREEGRGFGSMAAVSDSRGWFHLGNLILGDEYMLSVRNNQARTSPFALQRNMPSFELVLPRADRWLEGRVVDTGGNSLPGIGILVKSSASGVVRTVAGADGHYRIDGLASNSERVELYSDELGLFLFSDVPTNRTRDLILPFGSRSLVGKVTDPSGKPISGADLLAEEHIGARRVIQARTGSDGRFRLTRLAGSGDTLVVSHPKYISRTIVARGNDTESITLVLEPLSAAGPAGPASIREPYRAVCIPEKAPVVVDGNLNDWVRISAKPESLFSGDPAALRKVGLPPPGSASDVSASFRITADRDFVYFAVRVTDDTLRFGYSGFETPFFDDMVEVQFFEAGKLDPSGKIFISCERNGTLRLEGREPLTNGKYPYFWQSVGVRAAVKRLADKGGYAVEAAVPWSVLEWCGWKAGKPLGLNVLVYDRDTELPDRSGMNSFVEWAANPDTDRGFVQFDRMPASDETAQLYRSAEFERIYAVLDCMRRSDWRGAEAGLRAAGRAPWAPPMLASVFRRMGKPEEAIRINIDLAHTAPQLLVRQWAAEQALSDVLALSRSVMNLNTIGYLESISLLPLTVNPRNTARLALARAYFENGRLEPARRTVAALLKSPEFASPGANTRMVYDARMLLASIERVRGKKM